MRVGRQNPHARETCPRTHDPPKTAPLSGSGLAKTFLLRLGQACVRADYPAKQRQAVAQMQRPKICSPMKNAPDTNSRIRLPSPRFRVMRSVQSGIQAAVAAALLSAPLVAATPGDWTAKDFSGSGQPGISSSGSRAAARVTIANDHQPAKAEIWHLALTSDISVTAGRAYEVAFTVKASEETAFEVLLQKAGEPYTTFAIRKVTAGPEPVPVQIVGTSPFSTSDKDPASLARIVLALGKAPAGAKLSFDNIKFREIPQNPAPARATVDFARRINPPLLSGFLLGLDVKDFLKGPPDDAMVTPLRPKHWRVRSEWAERVAGWGAKPIVLCSEGRYPPAAAPWSDGYKFWREHVTGLAKKHGSAVVYDIWNEPDMGSFFLDWPDATFEKFLETFKEAHNAIRAEVPDAVISGPSLSASYPPYRLRQFLEFCKANKLTVQALALHMLDRDDVGLDAMKAEIARIRTEFIGNPQFAPVGVREIHVNEYAAPGDPSYRPASILAILAAMEESGVTAACRSCWDHPDAPGINSGFDGTLDGLLTHDTRQPRSVWWAYKWYAETEAGRVSATSSNPSLVVMASAGPRDSQPPAAAQILLASKGADGAARTLSGVSVQLLNLGALPFVRPDTKQLQARIERISFVPPGTQAVTAPELVKENLVVPVVRGAASLSSLTLAPSDVLRITLQAN
ncbi:MAG: hypothetical protein FGM15_10940 [Chthoniobacterales bacterium]|nr:hypothetical protein [Chthoniobacterales bacterium]